MSEIINISEAKMSLPKKLAIAAGIGATTLLAVFGAYEATTSVLENANFGPSSESILHPQGDK